MNDFDRRLAALPGEERINEICVEHRDQSSGDAVANLLRTIARPDGRQRRECNQITNAAPQLLEIGKILHPRHGHKP